MRKQILKSKVLVALVFLLAFTVSYSPNAFAWGGHGGHHEHYSYRGGHWYRNGWLWGGLATGLVIGAIVASLPPRHETVYVSGAPYYYYDGIYYKPCSSGYVVVPVPSARQDVVVVQNIPGERVTVNIPNSTRILQ